jgi:ribokinase
MSTRFTVIGSINMDLVSQIDRFPDPGETRTGKEFGTFPGGKGANQAVALARLGASVSMVGKVGDDVFGKRYREIFDAEGIDHGAVSTQEGSNGVAAIQVNDAGENIIIYTPGANRTVDPAYLDSVRSSLPGGENQAGGGNPGAGSGSPGARGGDPGAGFFLFQLELPLETVGRGLEICREAGGTSILDPAPAQELPASVLGLVDIITPNQGEAKLLTGVEVTDEDTARRAAEKLRDQGVGSVVVKAGAEGAYVLADGDFTHVPGFKVEVADTTAAGDSFNAGLAFALGRGDSVVDAVRFACAVGALSTTAVGAQSGMPELPAVEELMNEQG